jgi:hypothetical protein
MMALMAVVMEPLEGLALVSILGFLTHWPFYSIEVATEQ